MPPETEKPKNHISLDLRILVIALMLVIAAMIVIWKPWNSAKPSDRTVKVTGDATVSAEPDEYVFYPAYEFNNANQDAALTALTEKSNGISDELKAIGVKDSQIKTNADSYRNFIRQSSPETATFTLQLTITVDDKDLAQKVQDYLLTTSPTGAITPYPTFSNAKRKQLESEARDKATKDARTKAEQSAENLGFSIGSVKSVDDGSGFDAYPMQGSAELLDAPAADSRSLQLQPGENELSYSVTVVYYVK